MDAQDLAGADENELNSLADRIAETAARIDSALHQFLADIRCFDDANGWHHQGATSCAHWLNWRVGIDLGAAREKVRVAHALGQLALIDEALRQGEVSYSKVRAMTRVATPANEAMLLDLARSSTASQLEKICRMYRQVQSPVTDSARDDRRWMRVRETDDGMVKLEVKLTADEAALVMRACELSAETLAHDRALGLVAMAEQTLRGAPTDDTAPAAGHPPVEILVHIDATTLTGSLDNGHGLPPETCRRLLCDAGVVPVLTDAAGSPLDVGRKTRTISPALRRALVARDGGCTFPGCTHAKWVEAHHARHWQNGGETSLANTLLVCRYHHHLLHEGNFRLVIRDDGSPEFLFPDGREVPAAGPRRVVATFDVELCADRRASYPMWDGDPIDYDAVLDALVATDNERSPTLASQA